MWPAVSLWVLNLGALALYAALAMRSVAAGSPITPWIAGAPLLYFGVVMVPCAIYFAIAWIWRARRPRNVRIGWRRTLRLLWREYATLAGAAPRIMLYRALMRDPLPAPVAVPVVLVHGVLCNAGIWAGFARLLRQKGITGVYSLSYGPPLASIEVFADQLAAKIDAVLASTQARAAMIVGHSMGGLVARAYIRKYGTAKVARILTIGSPHHGSVHAWLFPGASLAELRPGNPWLAALNRERIDATLRFVSLWSWHDSMVAPQTSCELPGAIDVALVGVGHNALLGDGRVLAQALAEIGAAREAARVTSGCLA